MRVLVVIISLFSVVESQKNLSPDGTASQSSTFYYVTTNQNMTADLAITGEPTYDFSTGSCSTTQTHPKLYVAWWMLTFPVDTVYITNVRIYYRSNTPQRLAGYYLYVSNSSVSKTDGHLCYHHTGPGLPNKLQNVNCNYLGKHVIFYNERDKDNIPTGYSDSAVLELCHVEVYGCYQGWWDSDCSKRCSVNCTDGHCYPVNGSCVWGCKIGQDGDMCDRPCAHGRYGYNCNQSCDGCLSDSCDKENGICTVTTGCIPGRQHGQPWKCDKECLSGTFGDGCSSNCHCVNQPCDPVHGMCPDGGCQRGYNGDTCSTECSHGHYGFNCNQSCDGCLSDDCDKENGTCNDASGCKPGRQHGHPKCDKECGHGHYGFNCNQSCDGCLSDDCDKENGTCNDASGCKPGRQHGHPKCDKECSHGHYGFNCNQSCDGCLSDDCDKENGTCNDASGCKPGRQHGHPKCDKVCESETFGNNCSENCYCVGQLQCNKGTGICPVGGCERGYKGLKCSTECGHGHYGINCDKSCDGCLSDDCDRNFGKCTNTSGCKPGRQSEQEKCDLACIDGSFGEGCAIQCHCLNGTCNKTSGICPDTRCQPGWTGEFCSKAVKLHSADPPTSSIGPIVGGIGGVVVAIVLVVILVFFIRYRYANKKAKYHESGATEEEENTYANDMRATVKTGDVNISLLPSTSHTTEQVYNNTVSDDDDNNDEATYGNVQHNEVTTKYRIRVTELQNVISDKHTNNGFLKEYEILPMGLVRPHDEGQKEGNKIKNRFLNTLPYDHSRVIIHGSTTSDYINANYIDSYTAEKAYIASQGPKSNTMKDFWQMIWQERVDKIVMVTQLVEGRVVKCHQYWPESSFTPLEVGNIKVQMMQEKEHTVYVYRMIKLFNKEAKAERTVHHFHFTQWPDHGVPDKIKLVSFYRKVKRTKTTLNGPLTVHCSAGVGRTGTFIALDALYEHGQKTGYVDIMEYVQMMRKDRINMIQTKDQYTAVYEALLEALTVSDTAIGKDAFCEHLDSHQNKPKAKNQTLVWQEFQKLQDMKPTYPDKFFLAAKSRANIDKNAFQNILPHDSYRPFLMSYGRSRNDYINAVIIPECIGKRNILVTQYPLQDTVVDFWTMVYDTDSTVVVVLEVLNENVPLWPNHGDAFHYDKFNISNSSESSSFPLDITLEHKETNKSKTICVVSMTEWNTDNIPSSGTCMLDILNNVSSWRDDHPGSVTVVCRDGCKRSGVFAALSLVLEKIEIDDEVDIFQVVRTMQVRRPEFFPNVDQYEYCYQSIKEHLEENSIYVNA